MARAPAVAPHPWHATLPQPRNHSDPVTAAHLAGGKPGPVAKPHGRQGRAPKAGGDAVTSRASGARSVSYLLDYAPTTRSALSAPVRAVSRAATASGRSRRLGLPP